MELIHTCYRVTDPDRSVAFYEALGLEKRRELPIREEAVNYFLGVPGQEGPDTVREGGSRICFVRDPDSYRVELIEER